MLFLGIDTSCYTSSIAIVDENGNVLQDRRKSLEVKEGQRGLRQSEMIFQHINNLKNIFPEKCGNLTAVGASIRPMPQEDSYMPVFNVAGSYGEIIARTAGAFFYPMTHQEGHIGAGLYGNDINEGKLLCFHISGGTTELVSAKIREGVVENIKEITSSTDIAAGQLIDRTGVRMGLGFPAGEELSGMAEKGKSINLNFRYDFEKVSFSGIETRLIKMLDEGVSPEDVAATALNHISKVIYKVITEARERTGIEKVLMVGGVMRSSYVRNYLKRKTDRIYYAREEYSSDNAVGLALQARNIYLRGAGDGTDNRR